MNLRVNTMQPHILKMLIRGEDDTLDFKQTISSASKIAKTMAAFANHKGGTLFGRYSG